MAKKSFWQRGEDLPAVGDTFIYQTRRQPLFIIIGALRSPSASHRRSVEVSQAHAGLSVPDVRDALEGTRRTTRHRLSASLWATRWPRRAV